MPRSLLIMLMPLAMVRRWPDVASAALRSSDGFAVISGSLAFGLIATLGLWAIGAGLSEPYADFAAYLRSAVNVPPTFAIVLPVASASWALLAGLLMQMEPRDAMFHRAALRLVAASPLQGLLFVILWAPLQIMVQVRSPGFGLVAGKPRWLLDASWLEALGSMWTMLAVLGGRRRGDDHRRRPVRPGPDRP